MTGRHYTSLCLALAYSQGFNVRPVNIRSLSQICRLLLASRLYAVMYDAVC